jgi:hypothetical protein
MKMIYPLGICASILSCNGVGNSPITRNFSDGCYSIKSEKDTSKAYFLILKGDSYKKVYKDSSTVVGLIKNDIAELQYFYEVSALVQVKKVDTLDVVEDYMNSLGKLYVQMNRVDSITLHYKVLFSNNPHIVEDWGVILKLNSKCH